MFLTSKVLVKLLSAALNWQYPTVYWIYWYKKNGVCWKLISSNICQCSYLYSCWHLTVKKIISWTNSAIFFCHYLLRRKKRSLFLHEFNLMFTFRHLPIIRGGQLLSFAVEQCWTEQYKRCKLWKKLFDLFYTSVLMPDFSGLLVALKNQKGFKIF